MRIFLHSLRYGIRQLRSRSASSIPAILTLMIGLAIAAGVDSLVSAILWDHLSVEEGERVVYLRGQNSPQGRDRLAVLPHDFRDLSENLSTVEHLAAYRPARFNLSDESAYPDRYPGCYISYGVFDALRTDPILGRRFRPEEDLPGASPVVILSDRVWQRRFDRNPDVIGRMIQVNGETTEIIGVQAPGFRFPRFHDVWVPLRLDLSEARRGAGAPLRTFGRLADDASLADAQAEIDAQMNEFATRFPETNEGRTALVQPFARRWVADRWVALFQLLFAGGMGVLAIACANLIVLLLGRAVHSLQDLAVRNALGAGRGRLLIGFLGVSLVLSLCGAILAVPLAELLVRTYRSVMEVGEGPFWMAYEVDFRTIVVLFLLAILCGVLAGLYPAWRASRLEIHSLLKDSRSMSGLRLGGFLRGLVIVEVAIAFVLLTFAALLLGSLRNTTRIEIGTLDRGSVTTGTVSIPRETYPEVADRGRFLKTAASELADRPEIEMITAASRIPPAAVPCRSTYEVEGRPPLDDAEYPQACEASTLPSYFSKLGIKLLEGREFGPEDRDNTGLVAIITQSLAETTFPAGDAVGSRLRLEPTNPESPWRTIIGVVEDAHMGWLDEDFHEGVYTPHSQTGAQEMLFLITLRPGASQTAEVLLREQIQKLDRDLPVVEIKTWEEYLWSKTLSARLVTFMYTLLALAAAALALAGIYGVMTFSVGLRRREIGLRMALGADRDSILKLILRDCLIWLSIGLALGLVAAHFTTGRIAKHLYGLTEHDPVTLGGTALVVAVMVLGSGLIPAWRAARADPLETLRES